MIEIVNETNHPFDKHSLTQIASSLTDKFVEVLLVDDETIREINCDHRGKDESTDVLSFPVEPFAGAPLGSIVISVDTAKKAADMLNHSVDDEIKVLFLHGLLHLLGFDHEADQGEMRDKEMKLREEFGLPVSLTERAEAPL